MELINGGKSVEVSPTARERALRDNFFLAKVVLGQTYPDIVETTHKQLCDFFVQKNPNKPFGLQDTIKNRLLLAHRGCYKTSLDLVDCISWMLNFPNVTILMLSGNQDLATRMVEEVKQIFLMNTDFRDLFPDYIPTEEIGRFGAKGEFWLPPSVRTRVRREPTLSISTLDSVKASIHVDIRKGDDVVTEQNSRILLSQKIDQNDKVANDWHATRPLLNPGGYTDLIGTFYNFACLYGKTLDFLGLSESLEFGKPMQEERKGWKVAIFPALVPDENGELFNPKSIFFPEKFCVNANADPEKFNLQEAWAENPEHFNGQYMNHPIGTERDYFPMEALRAQTIPREKIPMRSTLFMVWDLAYKQNRRNDFTVGAVGAFDDKGNVYVIDLFRARWNPHQIVEQVIAGWRKWPLQRVGIEESTGAPLLMPALTMKGRELGITIPIDWLKISNKQDAVVNEILALSTLLGIEKKEPYSPDVHPASVNVAMENAPKAPPGKLWFVSDLPHLAETYVEFNRYGGKYVHDDIPRAVSLLMRYYGKGIDVGYRNEENWGEIGGVQAYGEPGLSAGLVG